jgi:hypothetical protein
MGALTGNTISSSYLGLLKTGDNAVLNSTLRLIEDGSGTDASIKLSTTQLGLSDGTTTVPSLTFSSNSDTGFYYSSDVTYYTLNGTTQLAIGSASLTLNNDSKLQWGTSSVYIKGTTATDNIQLGLQGATKLTLHQTTGLTLAQYGSGSITGTVTQRLGVTSAGQVVEIPIGGGAVDGSGTAGKITKWTDSDTIGDSLLTETTDAVKLADNKEFILGDDSDLTIKHSSTGNQNSIKSETHQLFITSDVGIELADNAGKSFFEATAGGSSRLFYNNSKKIETTNTGVEITGALTSTSTGTFGDAVRINATTTTGLVIASSSSSSSGLKLYNNSSTDNAYIYNHFNGNLEIGTNNATVLTMNGTNSTFAGTVQAENGTTTDPTFSFSSDDDTGIYRSAVNQLGFTAGGNHALTLASSSATFTGDVTVTGGDLTLGTNAIASSVNSLGDILSLHVDSDMNGAVSANMQFKISGSEKMRINNTGVGIGTNSPATKFVVSNGGASGIEFQPEVVTDTNSISNYDRTASAYMNLRTDALTQQFLISGSEKMRLCFCFWFKWSKRHSIPYKWNS